MTSSIDKALARNARRIEAERAASAPKVTAPPAASPADQKMISQDREALAKQLASRAPL